jgi:hypothetical protein
VAEELHPGVVAGVVDDVRRRLDQPLDDPSEPAVEGLEQLGLVAEQPRLWWRVVRPLVGRLFGT